MVPPPRIPSPCPSSPPCHVKVPAPPPTAPRPCDSTQIPHSTPPPAARNPSDIHQREPAQVTSPDQELSERRRIERQVEIVDRSILQVEVSGRGCAIDDGLVLCLLPIAAHCGIGCVARAPRLALEVVEVQVLQRDTAKVLSARRRRRRRQRRERGRRSSEQAAKQKWAPKYQAWVTKS